MGCSTKVGSLLPRHVCLCWRHHHVHMARYVGIVLIDKMQSCDLYFQRLFVPSMFWLTYTIFSECFILVVGHIIDVHIHPTGTCEEDYAILVGYHSGSSYTFTEEDAGKKVFFACDVGQRCEAGQNVVVEVAELLQVSSIERGVDSAASKKGVFSALALAAGVAAKMIL